MNTSIYYKLLRRCALALFLSCVTCSGYAQTISTVAGNGMAGFNGDEWTATATQLWSPSGIAVGGNGNIYVADAMNNRVRMINGAGVVTTLAGSDDAGNLGDNAPATDAQVNGPAGIATDRTGNIYISDRYNNRIRVIDSKGMIRAFAGTGIAGYSGDQAPASAAQLNAPTGITTDSAGNVYIADAGNHCVRKVTPAGIITTLAGTGAAGFSGDGKAATAALLNTPASIAIDTAGNIYIADSWNYRIRKISTDGTISTIAGTGAAGFGGDGKMDTLAELNLPTGLAADRAGNLFIADQGSNRIRKINAAGIITTYAGTGNAAFSGDGGNAMAGELNAPCSVALDAIGNLYIAEQQNQRIRKVTPPPAVRVVKKTDNTPKYTPPPFTTPPATNHSIPVQSGFQSEPIGTPAAPVKRNSAKNKG